MKLKHLGICGIVSLLSYTAMVVFSPLAYPGYPLYSNQEKFSKHTATSEAAPHQQVKAKDTIEL